MIWIQLQQIIVSLLNNKKKMGVENFRKIPNGINGIEDRMSVVWS